MDTIRPLRLGVALGAEGSAALAIRPPRQNLIGMFLLAVAQAFATNSAAAQTVRPFEPGMVITESTRIEPGVYEVPGPEKLDEALIVVRGQDITLDMAGVELQGRSPGADPDQARGIAVLVEGGSNITIQNGTIRGYRFGVVVRAVRTLFLVNNDLRYSWKPRLFSLVGHESLVDWMSFHNNENREWMRFGAAVYLEDVTGGQIRQNRAEQGMNGVLMVRTDSLWLEDNDFSYNSALGIGMYRSSHNVVLRNRMDYNVRGYSHGFYNRGQDSAGILLYEQSSHNTIAYNSVTHGGDGLFLWAGQSTMDTGQGGANDNVIFGNDFSWAPTNSIEVTFSRNRVLANRLVGSRYGVWGGYSYDSEFAGNCFGRNETGIAIEHGQDNLITRNRFDGDQTAVQLWSRESEPSDWGYPKNRDTRSRDHQVRENVFAGNEEVWSLDRTTGLDAVSNRVESEAGDPSACDPRELLGEDFDRLAPDLPGVQGVPWVERAALNRSAIIVDEWGPYDGRSPKLWPVDTVRGEVRLQVLGPPGSWRIVGTRGVRRISSGGDSTSGESGMAGDTLTVIPETPGDWHVDLEYVGEETVSPMGIEMPAGAPVPFSFHRFEPAVDWEVRFFGATEEGVAFREDPILIREEGRLDYMGYGSIFPDLPRENWGAEATGSVELPAGEYSIRTISDDAVRVWVDDQLVIDHWDPHESRVDYAPLAPGQHNLRVQYRQVGGWTELRLEIIRGSNRSTGSAGPH